MPVTRVFLGNSDVFNLSLNAFTRLVQVISKLRKRVPARLSILLFLQPLQITAKTPWSLLARITWSINNAPRLLSDTANLRWSALRNSSSII